MVAFPLKAVEERARKVPVRSGMSEIVFSEPNRMDVIGLVPKLSGHMKFIPKEPTSVMQSDA